MKIKRIAVFPSVLAATVALLTCGCSSSEDRKYNAVVETRTPVPPEYLTGPASALFTNSEGFSALVTEDSLATVSGKKIPAGRLVGTGSMLLFAPAKSDYTYIWDVSQHSGYMLSGALQGYAPISSPAQVVSLTTTSEAAGPESDRVNGHPGHEAEVSVAMSDGSVTKFTSWRASDLGGLPVRLSALRPATPLSLQLTDAKLEKISADLFQPPDGFTRFSSVENMMFEKGARGAAVRNGSLNLGTGTTVPPEKVRSGQSKDE
jgi:hypothetical protein